MSSADVLPIPTIVHLMIVDDPRFRENNTEVKETEELLPRLLAPADHERSVNAIWKVAGLHFTLVHTKSVPYTLQDIGLTEQDVREEGNEVPGTCDPTRERDRQIFRAIQQKFGTQKLGTKPFLGLQVFIWARIDVGGGCAMSDPGGTVGAVWLEAPSLHDPTGFRLMAHEIGHFLTLRHVDSPPDGPKLLMSRDFRGTVLTQDEIAQAKAHAHAVMNP
jgi:hypothetical protein